MTISARYFDGRTSAGHDVEVALYGDGRVTVTGAGVAREAAIGQIQVSERVGDTMRRFTFEDGAVCEILDNETVDQWLAQLGAHSAEHGVFRLERNWRYALFALGRHCPAFMGIHPLGHPCRRKSRGAGSAPLG